MPSDFDPRLVAEADQNMAELRTFINDSIRKIQAMWVREPDMDNLNTLITVSEGLLASPGANHDSAATLAAMAVIMMAEERLQ